MQLLETDARNPFHISLSGVQTPALICASCRTEEMCPQACEDLFIQTVPLRQDERVAVSVQEAVDMWLAEGRMNEDFMCVLKAVGENHLLAHESCFRGIPCVCS